MSDHYKRLHLMQQMRSTQLKPRLHRGRLVQWEYQRFEWRLHNGRVIDEIRRRQKGRLIPSALKRVYDGGADVAGCEAMILARTN